MSHPDSKTRLDREFFDYEHQVQVGLLEALTDLVKARSSREMVLKTLDQLVSYTEAHFKSEQLLMEQYAYPGYKVHAADHEAMLLRLVSMRSRVNGASLELTGEVLGEYRDMLLNHIASRDEDFHRYMSGDESGRGEE